MGPLSARQQNAIQMAFHWQADSGPRLDAGWDMMADDIYLITIATAYLCMHI